MCFFDVAALPRRFLSLFWSMVVGDSGDRSTSCTDFDSFISHARVKKKLFSECSVWLILCHSSHAQLSMMQGQQEDRNTFIGS